MVQDTFYNQMKLEQPKFSKRIHIRERNGIFYLDGHITYRGVKKRVHKSTGKEVTSANRKWLEKNLENELWELSDFYNNMEKEIHEKTYIPTLNEYAHKSINANASSRKENYQKKVISIYTNIIAPVFGSWKIDMIKPTDLKLFQSNLTNSGKSPKYVKNIRSNLRTILEDAVSDGILKNNPYENVKSIKVNNNASDPYDIDEITKILSHMKDRYKPMFALAFFTGMRWGEIIGLQWRDIDFENDLIYVNRSISEGQINEPKTRNSKAPFDMLPIVKKFLLIQKARGLHKIWVFVTQFGTHYKRTDKINQWILKPITEKLGLRYRPAKQTRHSFASLMLSNGEDPLWVANTMRHANKSTTLNIYAKYIPKKKINRAEFTNSLTFEDQAEEEK